MLEKRKWLLLTFYTTAGVMALERACTQAGLPGRIVPVPFKGGSPPSIA